MKKWIMVAILVVTMAVGTLVGCTEADIVSQNVSQQADNFNITRRLSVINMRTDKPIFEMVGNFSIETDGVDEQLEVVVEVSDGVYKKHFVKLNQWTMYVVEDVSGAFVDKFHYEVNFLPEMIQPITFISEE